jgi:hypothetical protein
METKNTFDEWFHQLEFFSLKSERFFGESDHYLRLLDEDEKREAEKIFISWLEAAFDAGEESGKKKTKS